MATIDYYLNLVPSENKLQPNFMAVMAIILQPLCENIDTLATMPELFDIDVAVGDQLDKTGEWIGVSRTLNQEVDGVTVLDDDHYRLVLYAAILRNHWDGTIPNAYEIWDRLNTGYGIIIIDNQNMTMAFGLTGGTPDSLTLALLNSGYLTPRPMGVLSLGSFTELPLFGLDRDDDFISGFDVGHIV